MCAWWISSARVSQPFTLGELAAALARVDTATETASSPAEAVARAELAPHVWARDALVSLAAGGEALVLVLLPEAAARRGRLRVWPDETLLAAARVPYLKLNNIHGDERYVCEACGAHYAHPNPLKVHLYLGCAEPSAAGFWRGVLAALRAGAGGGARRGPHPCAYCGKAYSRRYGLKIHMRTHTGHRPLRCPHCARAFGDPSNLNKHVRLHARPRPRAQSNDKCFAV